MATSLQVKRGVTAKVSAYTPLEGELVLDLTSKKLYAGDGSTAGGNQIVASKKGVTDGTNAATGEEGELLVNTTTGTAVTSGTALNAATLSLTAGDWDVSGVVRFETSTASLTALLGGLNLSSATQPSFPDCFQLAGTFGTSTQQFPVPTKRISITATTTIYLFALANFASGTVTANGYIRARRVR